MMLDIDFVELRRGFLQYLPIGALLGLILVLELVLVGASWVITPDAVKAAATPAPAFMDQVTNTRALGRVLYTQYVYLFQASGLILFVAMIGAIVLTLRHRPDIKRQNIGRQVGRKRDEAVEYRDVKPGQGL
jgi:NADH-quinone oxidoreductase subunit J